jgi:Uma2 family endonuclease
MINSLILDMQSAELTLDDEQFYRLCVANRDLRLERTAKGNLIIMPPTGWETGRRNFSLIRELAIWVKADGTGVGFDSSTGFILPNGAIRSPDAAWIKRERLEALNPNPNGFLPLCPNFAIELRSASDHLSTVREKMEEYLENGMQLGWLINPQDKQVEIYRQGKAVEVLQSPVSLSGEDVLSGFVLDLQDILS